jgi:hypothetical protein
VKVGSDKNDTQDEVVRLRNEVVAQAKELAVLRWEISALARKHPVRSRVTRVKSSIVRLFPKQSVQLLQLSRMLPGVAASLSRLSTEGPRSSLKIDVGTWSFLHGPFLFIGNSPIAGRIAERASVGDIVQVAPGAGFGRSFPVPPANEPTLRAPDEGSLVKWLIDNPVRLKKLGTIVLDAADDLSLGLLRGRLSSGQILLLSAQEPLTSPVVAELGEPDVREASTFAYSKFPAAWLDPLDESGAPIASVVSAQRWPKISVVMVSFNQAAFLEEGLNSVLGQGYPNLEFVVVDGNSTDGSIDILQEYRDRLTHLVIEPDDGQSDGLNKGFSLASGDILTWVNSDDLLEPGALFRVAQAFANPGVDMVAGGCRQIGLSRETIILNHHNRLPFGIQVALPLGLLLEMDRFWLTGSFFYQPEVFFSREIWKRCGGKLRTDLYYVLDYDLWVRMAAAGAHIIHIPDFLACSRTHEQQKTTVGMPYLPEIKRVVRQYSDRLIGPV